MVVVVVVCVCVYVYKRSMCVGIRNSAGAANTLLLKLELEKPAKEHECNG